MNWQTVVERTVSAMGYAAVDCERGPRGLLRVFIDRLPGAAYPTGPGDAVTVDDCEAVTRQLQHVLEVEGCAYERLEVSSPGLDRPLRGPGDYRRFAGCAVELTLKAPLQGRRKYRGVLLPEGEHWRVTFSDDGKTEHALDFALDEVREARLVPVVDFKGRAAGTRAPAGPAAPAGAQDEKGVRE
jgi:ribosome maturation factor RimP